MNIGAMTLTGLFVWSSFGTTSTLTPEIVAPEPAKPAIEAVADKTIKDLVEDEFGRGHIMVAVARCESQYRQFHDGDVLRGKVNPLDVGIFQINEKYHLATATKMELDIETTEDNIAYARHLYNTKGTAPWSASKPCWNK